MANNDNSSLFSSTTAIILLLCGIDTVLHILYARIDRQIVSSHSYIVMLCATVCRGMCSSFKLVCVCVHACLHMCVNYFTN